MLQEAKRYNIDTIGIIDSDTNPALVKYVSLPYRPLQTHSTQFLPCPAAPRYAVPGNDDSESAVKLYVDLFKQTILTNKVYTSCCTPLYLAGID